MRNREFVFTPKIEYKLVAERSEANQNALTFPVWCSILELVRTHFAAAGGEEIPPRKFGKAAEPHRSKPQKNPEKNIGSNHILILGEENFFMNLLIVIIASAIILFQTQYISAGFMWALIHGAGPASFLAFWPALVALASLWGGWLIIKYKSHEHRVIFSIIFSIIIIIVVEILMPITPLKAYLQQRAINSVAAESISDEILRTASGNPIGIRLKYNVTFPRDGIYSISPSQYSPRDGQSELYPLQFGSFLNTDVEPQPSIPEAGQRFFKANTLYHFTFDSVPNFLRYNERGKIYCLEFQPNKYYSDSDVKSAINNAQNVQYKTDIQTDGPTSITNRVVTKKYVTQQHYSVKDIYEGAIREGAEPCQF